MISVILANGDGNRFRNAGYKSPKHILPLGDGTVLSKVADTHPPGTMVVIGRAGHYLAVKEAMQRPFIWHGLTQATNPLNDLLQGVGEFAGQEMLVNFCDCWSPSLSLFLDKCRGSNVKTGVALFSSHDERHDYMAKGLAYGGIYWFSPNTLKPMGDSVLQLVKSYECLTYITRQYYDVGVPEDYERIANNFTNI